jgi:hypothetical protein
MDQYLIKVEMMHLSLWAAQDDWVSASFLRKTPHRPRRDEQLGMTYVEISLL